MKKKDIKKKKISGWDCWEEPHYSRLDKSDLITNLIYTMARCGSVSTHTSIREAGMRVLLGHWINYKRTYNMDKSSPAEHATPHFTFVDAVKSGEAPPLKVIVPIREPVARNIAAYFRVLLRMDEEKRNALTIPQMQHKLIKEYRIQYTDDWFKYELMDVFNFNPFELEFNHDLGYSIYNVGKHKILMIRLENYKESFSEAVYELTGVRGVEAIHINNFNDKTLQYREFKNTPLPLDWVEKNYNLRYAQHFWTNEERKALTEKWTRVSIK